MMGMQHNKKTVNLTELSEMLSQPEDDKPAETVLYEVIKVFNSKTMKKHWKKFTKASTEGKLKKKTEQ